MSDSSQHTRDAPATVMGFQAGLDLVAALTKNADTPLKRRAHILYSGLSNWYHSTSSDYNVTILVIAESVAEDIEDGACLNNGHDFDAAMRAAAEYIVEQSSFLKTHEEARRLFEAAICQQARGCLADVMTPKELQSFTRIKQTLTPEQAHFLQNWREDCD